MAKETMIEINNIDNYNDDIIFKNYSQMAQRMAFYAGIWDVKKKKFTIPLEKAIEYGKNIPVAMELEYIRLDNGHIPRKLTTEVVDELIKNNK